MIEIHNLNGFGKMVLANPPDPDRPISQENDFLSPVETATYRFCIDPRAKFFGALDRSHIRRGILITNRKPFFVDFSLGKDGSKALPHGSWRSPSHPCPCALRSRTERREHLSHRWGCRAWERPARKGLLSLPSPAHAPGPL